MKPLADLEARARECLAGKSRSYVEDARDFAEAVLVLVESNNVRSASIDRCSELLEENRRLNRRLVFAEKIAGKVRAR